MAIHQNKYTSNGGQAAPLRDSGNYIGEESINQRDFEDAFIEQQEVSGNSGNLQRFGLGSKFGQLAGTETHKAKKRYSYQSEQM